MAYEVLFMICLGSVSQPRVAGGGGTGRVGGGGPGGGEGVRGISTPHVQ
jgi:hypothetical protein